MSENASEKLSRVNLMADDDKGLTWDLSDNDRAALSFVLELVDVIVGAVAKQQDRSVSVIIEAFSKKAEDNLRKDSK